MDNLFKVLGHSRSKDIQGYVQGSGTFKAQGHRWLRSRFRDIQGSGTSKVTFKVQGHPRLRSRFRDIQGSGTFKVQGHLRFRDI